MRINLIYKGKCDERRKEIDSGTFGRTFGLGSLLLNDNSIYGERGDTQWVGDGCKWIKANMIAANDTEERMAA
jgi:hypothetical protein